MSKNEVKAGVVLSYIHIAVTFLGVLLFTPVLMRCLGQKEYGLYQLIGSLVGYLTVLDFGFSATIIRYVAKYRVENNSKGLENFLAMCLYIYGFLSMLIILAGGFLYINLDKVFESSLSTEELSSAKLMFAMLVFSIAVTVFGNVFLGALAGYEKYVFQRSIAIGKSFINLAVGAAIVLLGAKSVGLTAVNVLINCAAFALYAWYAVRKAKIRARFYWFDRQLFNEIFRFSFFVFLQGVMFNIYWKLGDLILGIMTSTAIVAVYSIAMQINTMLLSIVNAIAGVLLPKATRLAAESADGEKLTDFMVFSGRAIFIVYGLITTGFLLLGESFLNLWAGPAYKDAYYVVLIITITALIPRIQAAGNDIARAHNKHAFLTVLYCCISLFTISITILSVRLWGINGAAVGTGIAMVLGNTVIANIYFNKVFGIDTLRFFRECFSGILPANILTAVVGLVLNNLLPDNGLASFLIKGVILTAVYVVFIVAIGLNKNERKLIFSELSERWKYDYGR